MAPSRGATTSRTPLIGLWRTAALLAALSLSSPICATAQEEAAAPEPQEEGTQQASRYGNKLSGFVGGTAEGEGVAFTLGLDYERRLGRSFGLGALVDKAHAGNRAFIAAGASSGIRCRRYASTLRRASSGRRPGTRRSRRSCCGSGRTTISS